MTVTIHSEVPTRVRYLVLFLIASGGASAYFTRACLAAANTTIQRDMGIGNEEMGYIFAGFSLGYLWFQVPGAWIGTHFGMRSALAWFSALWSFCTAWTGLSGSLSSMWLSRVGFGLAQAGFFPCVLSVLNVWIPQQQRGIASAIVGSSMSLGAVLASGLTAHLLGWIGWRTLLVLYSGIGFAWSLAIYKVFHETPAMHPWCNSAERNLIEAPVSFEPGNAVTQTHNADAGGWWIYVRSVAVWTLAAQSFCRSFGYMFFITWFPAYLERGREVKLALAGLLTMVPLAAVVCGSLLGGAVVDILMTRTGSKWVSRAGTATIALGLCSLCTLAAVWAVNPIIAVLIVSIGSFLSGIAMPAVWAATMEASGKQTAIVGAILNMCGVAGDITCAVALGYLFSFIEQSQMSWNLVLLLFATVYFAAAVFSLAISSKKSFHRPNLLKRTYSSAL